MRNRLVNRLLVCIIILLLFVSFANSDTFAQSEEEAEQLIQQASEKLKTVLSMLEEIGNINSEVRAIVLQTDNSLQLINEAKQLFRYAQYDLSIQKANQALTQLENIEAEIVEINNLAIKESWLLYSIVGVVSAFATFGFVFLFVKKIYPWFKDKQIEEYGNLEIIYDKENGDK
jgi:ABC-type cobalt transport system substrate-binding protein